MIVAIGNEMKEYTDDQLTLYTFSINMNPIYNIDESELTTIQMPAVSKEHAWQRLAGLVGSQSKAEKFALIDEKPY